MNELSSNELRQLALRMAEVIGNANDRKPKLRVIKTAKASLIDAITRDAYLRRIRLLGRHCNLYWMIDQACFEAGNLDCLDDSCLFKLLSDMERARECAAENIPLEDAGFMFNPLRD